MAAAALGAVACLSVTAPAQAKGCGRVTIADMNWSSATFIAHVDQFVLSKGYGCDAELVAGDTMPTGTSMIEKGEPDIAPELWTNSFKAALDRGVKEGRLKIVSASLSDGGEEGFWVPKYMVDKDPSLATISGIKKNAKLFKNPEDPSTSLFMGCPSGWNCQITAGNLYKALKLKQAGFVLGDPGSGAGLAGSLSKAYERKEPWFGYYWAPTALLGKYAMVKVDFQSGINKKEFVDCISQADCKDPKPTMYPPSPVHTVVTAAFAKRAPGVVEYLSKRHYTNKFMNKFLAWMDANQADGEVAMEQFLKEHDAMWGKWVSDEAASKIKAALASM
jgi:glycine betaine/proline transport system substrate-binding protein